MNDVAREQLCKIVSQYGRDICNDPRRLRALLTDLCPDLKREVHLLSSAVEHKIVAEMSASPQLPWPIVAARLTRRMVDDLAFSGDAAHWAVESWGLALGLTITATPRAAATSNTQSNLLRWQQSGEPHRWVAAHQECWNHEDWLALLTQLRASPFWPMDPDEIGQLLETIKQQYARTQTEAPPSEPAPPPPPAPPAPAVPAPADPPARRSGLSASSVAGRALNWLVGILFWGGVGYLIFTTIFCGGLPLSGARVLAWFGWGYMQEYLGDCYYSGTYGVGKDLAEAARWYRQAAENGRNGPCFRLGRMYAHGEGVTRDEREARKWYERATDNGDVSAAFHLGLLFDLGRGGARDPKTAAEWYAKAANGGETSACVNLGLLYERGEGVAKDERKAVDLYMNAALKRDVAAYRCLGNCYLNGIGVKKDVKEAKEWFEKAGGDVNACTSLAEMYENGNGVPPDKGKAFQLYQQAAFEGDAWGEEQLGRCYQHGVGVKKNPQEAAKWSGKAFESYRRKAEEGDSWGQFHLGYCYDEGIGVKADKQKAAEWYTKAVDQGGVAACVNLGLLYERGDGVTQKDEAKAMSLYHQAADKGSAKGQALLGNMYHRGKGVPKPDLAKAEELYRQAVAQGDAWAMKRLADLLEQKGGSSAKDEAARLRRSAEEKEK